MKNMPDMPDNTGNVTHGWEGEMQGAGQNHGIVHGWEPAMKGALPMPGVMIPTQKPGMAMNKKKGK